MRLEFTSFSSRMLLYNFLLFLAACSAVATPQNYADSNQDDTFLDDDAGDLDVSDPEETDFNREVVHGWHEGEDLQLFLSDTDSESESTDDDYDGSVTKAANHGDMGGSSEGTDSEQEEADVWTEEMLEEDGFIPVYSESTGDTDIPEGRQNMFVRLLTMLLLVWQTLFKVSDNAVHSLLLAFKLFIQVVGNAYGADSIVGLSGAIPASLHTLRKCIGLDRNNFVRFVVCPKCMTRYTMEEAYDTKRNGSKVSRKCEFVPFYSHPHRRSELRHKCGTVLMKKMKSVKGDEYMYPKSTYCYKSVVESLQILVRRSGFQEMCERWRERSDYCNGMADVYDGKVWQEFQHVNGTPFLAEPNNLAFMANCDWYQPFKHSEYSVGVLYLVVLNLPREERFKEENMIVVGLIPGPKEPKLNINTFLEPLVEELQDLWKGVLLTDNSRLGEQLYRAALICLSSDIPAARKCGGFVGHGALRGCSKCLRTFTRTRFRTKADYSGFDRTTLIPRVSADHVRFAKMARRAKTKAERKRIEDQYGARWSELFRLPYYDAVRSVVIDPMHNLLLGTAKHVFKVWVELGVLDKKAFDVIQSRIDSMKVPRDVGRIPRKIASGFSGFTADQWKNWTCVFSLFCLKGLIDSNQYEMWSEFVLACRLLCSREILYDNLAIADYHLRKFLSMFAELCGARHCTPNMHLHLHLKECIEDFGPVYSFWCFSFERYNGMLGKYQHNNRNIEVQIMRKFQQYKQLSLISWPGGYEESFKHALMERKVSCASATTTSRFLPDVLVLDNSSHVEPLPPFRKTVISEDVRSMLLGMYHTVYPGTDIEHLDLFSMSCTRVRCNGVTLSVNTCRSERSACVHAHWCCSNPGSEEPTVDPNTEDRPAVLREVILVHLVLGNGRRCSHAVARVTWYEYHPQRWFYGRGIPVQVWGLSFEPESPASFIPVERLAGRSVASTSVVQFGRMEERVNVIVPLCTIAE
ncbi:Hypp2840 [Branchiostoma lanceolatum]|uniref:Hypp2840 protein n=1 Tax=Branchiostoma lanceolatum TaxID=7740 RepID=A0A8J9ZWC7_BRALA|nr:Hypp2840 [Branchiostoma lanceolatum]